MAVEAFRSRIGSALANRDYAELEAAWLECAGLHPEEHPYLLQVARDLGRHDKHALASELCAMLAEALLERGEAEGAFQAVRTALRASSRPAGLRETLQKVYRARYAARSDLDVFLDKSGLMEEGGDLRQQVDALDRFLTFEEGGYVYHRGGWGYGIVEEFDPREERMVVDFQKKRGHRIGIQSANKILERLTPEHFGVYRYYRAEELARLMKEEPARVFHIFLESHGRRASLRQMREEMVPGVLKKEEWSRWWARAKKAILKDPEIRLGKGSSPLLELRDRAKPIETEIGDRMRARNSGIEKAAVAREYLRSLDLTPAIAEAVRTVADAALSQESRPTAPRLALLFLKADLRGEDSDAAVEEARVVLREAANLSALIHPLDPGDRKRALLELTRSGRPDWGERMIEILRAGDPEVADLVLERLRPVRPDLLLTFFSELTANPGAQPELFLWYARSHMQGSIPNELTPGENPDQVMEKLLKLANQVGLERKRSGARELKELLRQVRGFLTARRMKTFSAYVERTSLDRARFLHAIILRNRGFTDQTKQGLLEVIENAHPDVHAGEEAAESDEVEVREDIVYTTMRGYHKREAELRQILEVDIPQVAEELGRAARFGDISENAEYSAALEKQGILMGRVRELRQDLERARVLDPSEVTTERIVIGTQVNLRNEGSGGDEAFSILGPWDVDLDRRVISYLSPVGRGLLGRSVGESVAIELPEGSVSYRVLSIEASRELARESGT
ncbi:MAG: transcription elongation factor GreA [Planctomycetota bacterium]